MPDVEEGNQSSAADGGHADDNVPESSEDSPPALSPRLRADRALVHQLRAAGFQGPQWDMFIGKLTAYGRNFLHKTICDSRIFQRCMEIGRPVGTSEERALLREHVAAREELVMDLLVVVAERFREHALRGGEWRPERGGSLRSYYVGALVLEFPNAYRRWRRRWCEDRMLRAVDSEDLAVLEQTAARMFLLPAAIDPARHAVAADLLERALRVGDAEIRKIAELRKLDWEWGEIGAALDKSGKAASEKWRRFCAAARKQQEGLDEVSTLQGAPSGPSRLSRPPQPRSDEPPVDHAVKEV
ncbi:hypothetical protein ACFRIB_52950 [Streptomyces mirabilis]|uniref:hypothetical protein n=1 Tax=Streptomyces mirabilis TaxID=68239 RepID=UPI0036B49ECE